MSVSSLPAAAPRREGSLPGLCRIVLAALAIRWSYDIALFSTMGAAGVMGVDSDGYLQSAEAMAAAIARGSVTGFQWLGPTPYVMPLFTWMMTTNVVLFGGLAPLAYVMFQGILDSATCVIIGRIAAIWDDRLARPAVAFAAVNPTQVMLAGLLYTDTPFLFFAALFLLGTLQWMRSPSWPTSILIGMALGAAMLTRVLVLPWAIATLLYLPLVAATRRTLSVRHVAQIVAMAAIGAAFIAPVLLRNVTQYGAWSLTPQDGQHLSRWIVPLIKEVRDGTPWAVTYQEMELRRSDRYGPTPPNPFVQSAQYRNVAMEELRRFSFRDIAAAWLYGAALNIGTPAIILSPPVLSIPRTGFYATSGHSMPEKIANFLFRSESAIYVWCLLSGIAGVALIRIVQGAGLFSLVTRWSLLPELLLLLGWCVYVLLVNGPVASPKYRLPMEAVLVFFSAAGWVEARQRIDQYRERQAGRYASPHQTAPTERHRQFS